MFAQTFALSTRQRLDRCKAYLESFSISERTSFGFLTDIQQELNALEGEALLLEFNTLGPVINAILENMDTSRPEMMMNPDVTIERVRRGLDSIFLLLRMWISGSLDEHAVGLLVSYIRELTEFPAELDHTILNPQETAKRILLIDDSEITREMIQFSLEAEGHEVVVAGDLLTFDKILQEFNPQIILTDVNMPDIQGDEICKVLKAKYDTSNIPIILFSSLDDDQLATLAERAGADGYVSKQRGIESLIKQINEVVFLVLW